MLLLSRPASADHIPYTITPLYTTSGSVHHFYSAPSINSFGSVVAFWGTSPDGFGVLKGAGGPVTKVAAGGVLMSLTAPPLPSPSINSSGAVVFYNTTTPTSILGNGIYKGSGGPVATIADTDGPFSRFLDRPSINSSGTVAFQALRDDGGSGIYAGSGGPVVTTLYDTSGPFSHFGNPSINDSGTVAFQALRDDGVSGIYIGNGGPTATPIADTNGPFSGFAPYGYFGYHGAPKINLSETVAFWASLDTGGEGIFTGRAGAAPTPIADTSGLPFSSLVQPFSSLVQPSINSSGTVAFKAELNSGGRGIYTNEARDINRVVKTGDTILGSKFTDIDFWRDGLNNMGQVVFSGDLADGTRGLFLASPPKFMQDFSNDFKTLLPQFLAHWEGELRKKVGIGGASKMPFAFGEGFPAGRALIVADAYLTKGLRLLLQDDPPDENYQNPVAPIFYDLNLVTPSDAISEELAALLNSVLSNQGGVYSYLQALMTTVNRYSTALNNGDLESAAMQYNAFVNFLRNLSEASGDSANAFQSLQAFLQGNGFPNIEFTMDDVQSYLNLLATNGFSDKEMQVFNILGLNQLDIDAMLQMALSADLTGIPLDFYSFLQSSSNMYLDAEMNFQPLSQPVPEPCTLTLLGLGLVGLAGVRRWRKQ